MSPKGLRVCEYFKSVVFEKISTQTQFHFISIHDQIYYDFFQTGFDAKLFKINLEAYLALSSKIKFNINYELDIFNIKTYENHIKDILAINAKFKSSERDPAVYVKFIDMSRKPWWSFVVLNKTEDVLVNLKEYVVNNQWDKTGTYVGLHAENIEQIDYVHRKIKEVPKEAVKERAQTDFMWKLAKQEEANGLSFTNQFPHLKEIFEHCKLLNQQKMENYYQQVRNKLNKIGSGFCLAKWTTVTLHLESGTTHSCHHPSVHQISLDEIKSNPSAIHNSKYKIEQRKQMIEGQRPSECNYCWNIEDLKTSEVSDRFIKSGEIYNMQDFDKVVENPLSDVINPRYVEVSFSNKCQFKCSYCSADYSSTWVDEISKYGNYSTGSGALTRPVLEEEVNPYVEAFWKWWPHLKPDLHTLRVTGGEPLLSPSTFKLMEDFIRESAPNLHLAINSNLGIPKVLFEKFLATTKKILELKAVANFKVFTSIDAYGAKAEYIRNGFKSEVFWSNVEALLEAHDEIEIVVMCTFNALSVTSADQLVLKVTELNAKYKRSNRVTPIAIDFSYLRHPEYQAVKVLPQEYQDYLKKLIETVEKSEWMTTEERIKNLDFRIIKIRRILEWMREEVPEELKKIHQRRFYEFFSEHDRRRNTNFLDVFPEMESFWHECKKLAEETAAAAAVEQSVKN